MKQKQKQIKESYLSMASASRAFSPIKETSNSSSSSFPHLSLFSNSDFLKPGVTEAGLGLGGAGFSSRRFLSSRQSEEGFCKARVRVRARVRTPSGGSITATTSPDTLPFRVYFPMGCQRVIGLGMEEQRERERCEEG